MQIDFEKLTERFCIMTVDGKLSDEQALQRFKRHLEPDTFERLKYWAASNPIEVKKNESIHSR